MRFLVVDDDEAKALALREQLMANGLQSNEVVIADCAVTARRALLTGSFDAMLLDVLLPIRKDGLPSGGNSIELLREIIDDGSTSAPRYIVGVTAESKAAEDYASEFRRLTSHVIVVSPEESAWKEFLHNFVAFIKRADAAKATFDVDICVLNALKVPELDAVLATWPISLGTEKLLNSSVVFSEGTCNIAGGTRRIVCGYPGQMGPIASTHAATTMLEAFRPRILLMTGICGGFSDSVSVGDVVIAERSWDWQSGKWSENGALLAAPDHREASGELVARARTIEAACLNEIAGALNVDRPTSTPRLVFGPMVTGSSVVASDDIQKVFRSQHRKIVGVDMECYGIYYATSVFVGPPTKALCVKAVSDLADRAKSDDFQKYCSHLSAAVGLELVTRYFASLN